MVKFTANNRRSAISELNSFNIDFRNGYRFKYSDEVFLSSQIVLNFLVRSEPDTTKIFLFFNNVRRNEMVLAARN